MMELVNICCGSVLGVSPGMNRYGGSRDVGKDGVKAMSLRSIRRLGCDSRLELVLS